MAKYFGVIIVIVSIHFTLNSGGTLQNAGTLQTVEEKDFVIGERIKSNPYYLAHFIRDRFRILKNQVLTEIQESRKEIEAIRKLVIDKCPGSSKYNDGFNLFTLTKYENISKWLSAEDNSDEPISIFEHETSFDGFKLIWQFEVKKQHDFFIISAKIIGSSEEEVYFSNDIYIYGNNEKEIRKKEGPILREKVVIGLTWPLQLYIDSEMLRENYENDNSQLKIVINQYIYGAEHLVYTKPLTEVPSTSEEFTFVWELEPNDFLNGTSALKNQTKRFFSFEDSKWSTHLQLEESSPHLISDNHAVVEMHIRLLETDWSEVYAKRKITKYCPPYSQITENFEGRNYLEEEEVMNNVYKMDYKMSGRCSLILNFKILGKGTRLCDAIKKDSKRFQMVNV